MTAAFGAAIGVVTTGAFAAVTSTGATNDTAAAAEGTGTTAALAANATVLEPSAATDGIGDVAATVGHISPVAYTASFGDPSAADAQIASLDKAGKIADQIAAQHAEEARKQAEADKLAALMSQGGVDGWIAQALAICDLPQDLAPSVKKVIMSESGGNPRAINNWDSNARRGTPSQGLMQVIPSTFRAYVHPSLAGKSINDPVANITAGVRYMVATYGLDTLEAGGRTNSSGNYVGY
jgi:soluble lytic murein transglycosylase-like protein